MAKFKKYEAEIEIFKPVKDGLMHVVAHIGCVVRAKNKRSAINNVKIYVATTYPQYFRSDFGTDQQAIGKIVGIKFLGDWTREDDDIADERNPSPGECKTRTGGQP